MKSSKNIFYIFLNLVLYVQCSKYEAPNFEVANIIGGSFIYDRVPYQVSMQYAVSPFHRVHFCGASIISKSHVLTAAHCLRDKDYRGIILIAGTNDLNSDKGVSKSIKTVYLHKQYNPYIDDIGILITDTPFIFDKFNVGPIEVLNQEYISDNVPVVVTGWGARIPKELRHMHSMEYSAQLKALSYRTITNKKCRSMGVPMISKSQLCTIKQNVEGACIGDSGSPLVTFINDTLFQVGIVSYGNAVCGLPSVPDIYTRVHLYNDWIENILLKKI